MYFLKDIRRRRPKTEFKLFKLQILDLRIELLLKILHPDPGRRLHRLPIALPILQLPPHHQLPQPIHQPRILLRRDESPPLVQVEIIEAFGLFSHLHLGEHLFGVK